MTYLKKWLFISLLQFPVFLFAQVDVQLATSFSDDAHAEDYLISEKYDGVRAIWTGERLITRQGNPIHAPDWFTAQWPNVWLDGELWSKHHDFEFVMSTVSKNNAIDSEWRKIYYMIFDAPDKEQTMPFELRSQRYRQIANEINLPHVIPIKQFTVANNKALHQILDEYVQRGAEGLMLHRKSALFESGRTDNLLKLKPHMDAEAKVIEILNGAGKFDGMMGSMLVEMPSGLRFKIGSGFSDEERRSPPKVGDYITYKYHGFTGRGVPRFASFIRLRVQGY